MASATPFPIALGRFRQLPQRSNEVWQGGLVKLPAWVDDQRDPAAPPHRPVGALWISLRTGLVHLAFPDAGTDATPDLALKALIDFGLKESKRLNGRPSVIEVRDPQIEETLAPTMSALNTSVALVAELPAVADALRHLEMAAGGGQRHAGTLENTGVTVDQLRAFAGAAAAFFQAQPWRHLTNEDLIIVKAPRFPKGMRHLCVLGNAGEQFGLAFFDSRQAFERIYDRATAFTPRRAFGVTYGPIDDLPFADVDAWEDLSLPVVNPQAYPLAADLSLDGTMRRLNAAELVAAEALLRALAQTTERELDSGSWRRVVDTADGPTTLELTLPFLLEAQRGRPSAPRLGVMPRVAERASARLARLLEQQSFESLDDANAAVKRAEADGVFDRSAEVAVGRSLSSLEQAQELAYDAMEATGRLRITLARRALALSADCADACVILGESAADPQEAREWYERGVDAGVRALGPDQFAALQGQFWGHLETRPYMRARVALAQTLHELGHDEAALEHYRELLRLNPGDNQGVRYLLLPALIERGRGEEADRLLAEYEGDIQATWPYARALRTFQVEGDTAGARVALGDAARANPHVIRFLIDPSAIPPVAPPHFALGSKEEGAYVAEGLAAAVDAIPGARAWLQTFGSRLDGHRRPRRPANRSRRR